MKSRIERRHAMAGMGALKGDRTTRSRRPVTRTAGTAALMVALAGAGCVGGGGGGSGGGSSGDDGLLRQFVRGSASAPAPQTPTVPESGLAFCPRVRIQAGTETLRRETGGDGPANLNYQASINRTARECSEAGERVAVRVGVSGRVIEGPAGAPETVTLPLRIAVREAGNVTYSELHQVRVSLPGASEAWAYVDEDITVSEPRRAEILVGFDG